MHVDVSRDARARAFANIHSEVQSVGMVEPPQMPFRRAGQRDELGGGFLGDPRKIGSVTIRHDHQVPVRIGESVQNNEIVFGAVNDERFFVAMRFRHEAEDAAFRFVSRQVGKTPRAPEVVQAIRRKFRVKVQRIHPV